MPPAVIAAGVVGAATIGGSAIASSSSRKAANQAADVSLRTARENNALAQQIRAENAGYFQPYMQSGQRANALLDSFIYGGVPASAPAAANSNAPAPSPQPQTYYPNVNTAGVRIGQARDPIAPNALIDIDRIAPTYDMSTGQLITRAGATGTTAPTIQTLPAGGNVTSTPNALTGWQQFVASPYYQNPLQEGFRALNSGLASGGMLESGDAMKRAIRYGQDYGAGRQDEYLGYVTGQANRGFGAASAMAGVGQNFLDTTSANNRSAADAAANAALLKGQANNALIGNIGGALGSFAGTLATSYKW